ncbi:amidase family protein [Listeria cornellensis]|uniref:Amidase n=1 Tax=Listeria cornellensis FSL F6-0969 TaxID=1265820 RepID=W7BKT6_9LIST|nr:amidase family protein [Listeria cornellensis]EUJ26452.1 amidase [Listeria cornellensis FSL F6-0969]
MKKGIIIGSAVTVLILVVGVSYWLIQTSDATKSGEAILYEQNRVLDPVNEQLKTLDISRLEAKEKLVVGAEIDQIQQLIATNKLSYEELVGVYLNRIKKYDKNGPKLNAITEINPDVLEEARTLDQNPSTNKAALYGIPVLLKDNIGTQKLATSAGTVALQDWVIGKDATIVKNLKANGALILGKTNMSEWANYMDPSMPSGYSGKIGQNKNPYLDATPSGSSSGSATAATSDFAAVTIGTETNGSIISPAIAQSAVGFKPSRDTVSGELVIPLSRHFDTPGPITRTVKDAYLTAGALMNQPKKAELSKDSLKGKRIGVLFDADDVVSKKIVSDLEQAGAKVIKSKELEESQQDFEGFDEILQADFKTDLNQFLKKNQAPMKDLAAIIAFNKSDKTRNMKYGQGSLEDSEEDQATVAATDARANELIKKAGKTIESALTMNNLDALVTLNDDNLFLVPIAGNPELTIPAGYAKDGQPIGMTFVGRNKADESIFAMGYAYEQFSENRKSPVISADNSK